MYNKQQIFEKIRVRIASEAAHLTKGALNAHEYATNPESKAEGKYDTRGLEASYLAAGQAKLAAESTLAVSIYNTLILKAFSPGEAIALTAMVELEYEGERLHYFIGPKNGGISIAHEGETIVLITPTSPLGQLLMGKKAGDYIEMRREGSIREYEIIRVE